LWTGQASGLERRSTARDGEEDDAADDDIYVKTMVTMITKL